MSEIDTSMEEVKRLRYGCENYNGDWLINNSGLIAATLRALVAERDMWRAENAKKQEACEQMGRRIAALEAEVAAREQAARWEGMEKAAKLHDEWARDEWSAAHQCNQWAHTPAEHGRLVSNALRHEASAAAIRAAAKEENSNG